MKAARGGCTLLRSGEDSPRYPEIPLLALPRGGGGWQIVPLMLVGDQTPTCHHCQEISRRPQLRSTCSSGSPRAPCSRIAPSKGPAPKNSASGAQHSRFLWGRSLLALSAQEWWTHIGRAQERTRIMAGAGKQAGWINVTQIRVEDTWLRL